MHVVQIGRPAVVRLSSVAFPFFAFTVVIGACSANNGPKYPNLSSFCNARAMAECSDKVRLDCASPSAATCVAGREKVCAKSLPSGATYVPTAAENCINQVSSAYQDAMITIDESKAIDDACRVFDGPGGSGATCQVDLDCKESMQLRCVLSAGSTMGTCQIPVAVMAGMPCAAPNAQCVTGFHCGLTAHCDSDGALNDSCTAQPCGPGLLCSSAGTCQSKAQDGSPCMSGSECQNGICNNGGTGSGLCVSQITLSPSEPFCTQSR